MIQKPLRAMASVLAALTLTVAGPGSALADHRAEAERFQTKTPIKHIVVIFQENVSFDHYFGTYPHAHNPGGEPQFNAADDTPRVDNLLAGGLLHENTNSSQ